MERDQIPMKSMKTLRDLLIDISKIQRKKLRNQSLKMGSLTILSLKRFLQFLAKAGRDLVL